MAADRFNSSSTPEARESHPRRFLEWPQRISGDRVDPIIWGLPRSQLPQSQPSTPDDDEDLAWDYACDEIANETRNGRVNYGHPAARSTRGMMLDIPRFSQSPRGTREQTFASQSFLTKYLPGWPMHALPTELFEKIAGDLARDDILNMRLVNHEFEKKVSGFLFKAVVVPFQRQIYGITTRAIHKQVPVCYDDEDTDEETGEESERKGGNENIKPLDGNDHDGMEVFKAWGPHIKKFAISFEFDEGEIVPGSFVIPSSISAMLTPLAFVQMYSTIPPRRIYLTSIMLSGGSTPGIAQTTLDIPPVKTWKTRQTRITRWLLPSRTSRKYLNWAYRWMVV